MAKQAIDTCQPRHLVDAGQIVGQGGSQIGLGVYHTRLGQYRHELIASLSMERTRGARHGGLDLLFAAPNAL